MPLVSVFRWIWYDPIPRLLAIGAFLAAGASSDALHMNAMLADKPPLVGLTIALLWIGGPILPVFYISARYIRALEWRKVLAAETHEPADAVHQLIGLRAVIRGVDAREYAERSIYDRIALLAEWHPISTRTISYLHDELLRPDEEYVLANEAPFRDLLTVLKILPAVGNSYSLTVLAACEQRFAASPVIVEVARESAGALQGFLEKERLSESLLRPAENSRDDILLRPRGGNSDSSNLLIASEPASGTEDPC